MIDSLMVFYKRPELINDVPLGEFKILYSITMVTCYANEGVLNPFEIENSLLHSEGFEALSRVECMLDVKQLRFLKYRI